MTDITEWLDGQLRARGWDDADLCREADIASGTLSNARTRNKIGLALSRKIAKAFKMKHWEVAATLGANPRTGKMFLASTVHYILHNPFYFGRVVYGRNRTLRHAQGKSAVEGTAKHPPIWDAKTQKRIEQENERRRELAKRGPRRSKHLHLFAGILRCGFCGRPMASAVQTQQGRMYLYYKCNAPYLAGRGMDYTKHAPNHISELRVLSQLQSELQAVDDETIELLAAQPIDITDTTLAERRLRETEARIVELQAGLEAVRGVPTAAQAILMELERERRAAERLRADIEGADLPIDVDSLRQAMYSLRDGLSLIDSVPRPELRRRIREALPALYARNGRLVSSPKD